jgi:hypothetical protein
METLHLQDNMFEVKKGEGRWGRDLIQYTKSEKQFVKEYILSLYQNMKYPDDKIFTITSELTTIWWKDSVIRGSDLHIKFNIAFVVPYKIEHMEYPRYSDFYYSERIDLKIPFDALLSYKRNKVLEQLV